MAELCCRKMETYPIWKTQKNPELHRFWANLTKPNASLRGCLFRYGDWPNNMLPHVDDLG